MECTAVIPTLQNPLPHHLPADVRVCKSCYNVNTRSLTDEARNVLTLRPATRLDSKPLPYPVFTDSHEYVAIPRYAGYAIYGEPIRILTAVGESISCVFKGKLREYQADAVNAIVAAVTRTNTSMHGCILQAQCGTGKTCMALAVVARLGVKAAIVVHKGFLVTQWKERIRQFLPDAKIGICQGRNQNFIDADICIFMLQTVCGGSVQPEAFLPWGILVVDEAHHIAAKWFQTAMSKFPADVRIGLTATPDRSDGLGHALHWYLGPTVYKIRRSINSNTATPVVIRVRTSAPAVAVVHRKWGKQIDYVRMETALTMSEMRNKAIASTVKDLLKRKRRIIVMSSRRAHLLRLQSLIGIDITCLYVGETSKKRKRIRDTQSLIAPCLLATYNMGEEGLDIPILDTIVFATPKSNLTCLEQSIGRILRTCAGKVSPPLIMDFDDNYSLYISMRRKRNSMYKRNNYTVHSLAFTQVGTCVDRLCNI